MATSNEMMRPVILSRPENTAVGLAMRCGGGSTTTSSPGCGAVLAGCGGAPRGWRWPGGRPGKPAGPARLAAAVRRRRLRRPVAGRRRQRLRLDGAAARAARWRQAHRRRQRLRRRLIGASAPGRALASREIARCWLGKLDGGCDGGALGTSAGGRGGSSRKMEPNCAKPGVAAMHSVAIASRQIEKQDRAISRTSAWETARLQPSPTPAPG